MSTYGDPHWTQHPAVLYANALERYRWASVQLYRARDNHGHGLCDRLGVRQCEREVLVRLDYLFIAQETLHKHVLRKVSDDRLADEILARILANGWDA